VSEPRQERRERRGGPPRCAFCGKARGETSSLHGEHEWVRICNGCVYDARALRAQGPGKARRCSFCEAEAKDREWIFGGRLVSICNGCVDGFIEEVSSFV